MSSVGSKASQGGKKSNNCFLGVSQNCNCSAKPFPLVLDLRNGLYRYAA